MQDEFQVRLAAFQWLTEQVKMQGEVLSRTLLQKGFEFFETRVSLMAPQGIFIPKILHYPLSITTTPHGPYEDLIGDKDFILYKYRGKNPDHRENVGLREAMRLKLPLVYFYGIMPGKYMTIWPVYIIDDNPAALQFKVAVDDARVIQGQGHIAKDAPNDLSRKRYITKEVRYRLHQRTFREKVLMVYQEQCALCKLRYKELLDAAHIIPDAKESSRPSIDNGISLCKLHHAAFDRFLIGIRPDFKIEVRNDILKEKDGPMLQYGLQAFHGTSIILPIDQASWPNRNFLKQRYEEFEVACRVCLTDS